MKNICYKFLLTIFASSLLFSCSSTNSDIDFDFTTLKKSKKIKVVKQENKNKKINQEKNSIIEDLVPLRDRKEILSKIKFGKKDPFSEGEFQSNKLLTDLILKGFLNTENNKYVFVSYLDNEGSITKDSVGGVNTTLLPNGAKVINIDSKNMQLIISVDNENYIFEM